MSSSGENLENYRIPLDEIRRATNNFSSKTQIGDGGFGMVYFGQLSDDWKKLKVAIKRLNRDGYQGNNEFRNELKMVSSFHHPNIISFIGYCDEANEMIIVYEYATNGSLDRHLQDPKRRRCITWAQRLNICLGAARGLKYLHSGLGEKSRVIHRDVKSANILLDDNLEAKICDFGLSRYGPRNQPRTELITKVSGTRFYMDPIYNERGRLSKESDVYSFGVVLFEMSSGTMAYHPRRFGDAGEQYLMDLVRSHYDDDEVVEGLDTLLDPEISGDIDMRSFHMFNKIAHGCVNFKLKQRPTIDRIIEGIQEALNIQNRTAATSSRSITTPSHQDEDLKTFLIPLEEIMLATKDFNPETRIGDSASSMVYKGKLSEQWQNRTVAIKRLDQTRYLGNDELLTELKIISTLQHKNIIPFIGYCDEGSQMITVYEYASKGSLDHLLLDSNKRHRLSWTQRLKICLGVARGLDYLHSGPGKDNEIIHKQFTSRNVLLDENLEAKVCDIVVSREGVTNKKYNEFYLDPVYLENGIFCTETDVYSFGILLFEMLSGTMAYHLRSFEGGEPQPLINLVRHYNKDGLDRFVDPFIKYQIDSHSLATYKELAFQCISYNIEERPTINKIMEMIESAINFQVFIAKLVGGYKTEGLSWMLKVICERGRLWKTLE